MDFKELQKLDKVWVEHNFPNSKPHCEVLGVGEEIGELALADQNDHIKYLSICLGRLNHGYLKMEQNIRGSKEKHIAEMKDAIGDMMIFVTSLCNRMDFDLDEIVTETADQVFSRDWIKYPFDGKTR